MDPVSRVLEQRERRRLHQLPWLLAALVLHAAVGLGVVLVARIEPPVRTFSPSVSVRLVHLPRARRRPPRRAAPAAPSPAPTAAPVPTAPPAPTPAPTAPPRRRSEPQPEPEQGRPSEHAMAEPTPGPTATPLPAATPGAGGVSSPSGALSLGGGEAEDGGPPALPSDFRFTYYVQRMLTLIEGHWYKPPVPPGTRARVRFTVLRSGRVTGIALEESSGIPSFDRAALRALYAANPLPPLPPGYARQSITVHLTFSERP